MEELTKALEAELAAIEARLHRAFAQPPKPAPSEWRHDFVRARRLRELLPYQPPPPRPPVDLSFLRRGPVDKSAADDTTASSLEIVDGPSAEDAPLALSSTEDRTDYIINAIRKHGPPPLFTYCMLSVWSEHGGTEACDKMRKSDVADAMEREIRSKWPAGLSASPSRRDAEKMASFVRSPKAKEGGRKSQG